MSRSRHPPRSRAAILTVLVALCGPALAASGLGWLLDDSAMRHFNAEDGRLMSSAIDAVLAAPEPTTSQDWRNPATGSHGAVVGLKAFQKGDLACRRLRVTNYAGGVDGGSVVDLCLKDGEWKLLGFPPQGVAP